LADEFQKLGGDLRTGARWQDAVGDGIVQASGRRLRPVENGWRWFGLKVHAKNVSLEAGLEMHLARDGYVGICRLATDEVNVCGLFRRNGGAGAVGDALELLRGAPGSVLRQRLAAARFEQDSFCSVAGLSLRPQRAIERSECCIGDALTMIPPVTGNGMSLAFESAALAIEPLAAYSRGQCSWAEIRETIARRCDEQFSRRLAWAGRLQSMLFSSAGQKLLMGLTRCDWFWRWAFERTR